MSTNNFDNHRIWVYESPPKHPNSIFRCNGCNEKLTQTNKIYYLRLTENDFVFCETCAKTIRAVLNSW